MQMFYKLFYYYAFSEIIIVQKDVDRRCWCPVFEHEPGPLLVHCVHHYKLITAVAASPAAAHSRPTLGVSCKLSKSNLSVCSILFTPAEFIHIFITGLGRGAEMPGDWRGCQQINWCLAILCYTGLQWHNVTDNVDIFILLKDTPLTPSKLRITSTCLTDLDTSSDMFYFRYIVISGQDIVITEGMGLAPALLLTSPTSNE